MSKKVYIQLFITSIILLIIVFIYMGYFKDSSERIIKTDKPEQTNKIITAGEDLITDMAYFSEDENGNKYEINSRYGVLNPAKSDLILMDKVTAIVYLSNGGKIYISSDKAKYNEGNNDTTFEGSVEMKYDEHIVKSDYLDLSFQKKLATLYQKVVYKSSLSNLIADKIIIDFLNRNTKILMDNENKNILVKSVVNNGNN